MTDHQLLLRVGLVALTLAGSACDSSTRSYEQRSEVENFMPRAITDLRSLNTGEITLSLAINGIGTGDVVNVSGASTSVNLDSQQLRPGENTVSVTFYFESLSVARRPFVTGNQTIMFDGSVSPLLFSGLHYEYVDSDNDSIHDVHELAVLPVDIDSDARLNPDDPDSDGDTIPDGADPSPWGAGSTPFDRPLFAEIDIQLADGSDATLKVDHIAGSSGETARLASLSQSLQLQYPVGWPVASQSSFIESNRWTAFEWRVEDRGLCGDFRIPLDVSSLQLHSSSEVIMYFQRYTGPPVVTTLTSAELADLDRYSHTPPFDGDGPLHDALRIIFVPEYHAGWIDVWTGKDFSGDYCSVNLTTPSG